MSNHTILESAGAGMLDATKVGGKAQALATIARKGFDVPPFVVVPTDIFSRFMSENSLWEMILSEISRKELSGMRWEEMWDASLRIRNMITKHTLPAKTTNAILNALGKFPRNAKFAVRSSSTIEDGSERSFAGIHESFVDVGRSELMEKIKLVWASLWSPSAFTYAKELGHDLKSGNMAVIIQQFERGEYSGVMFSKSPVNPGRLAIEAVPGMNQGFVDGRVEPWRWTFERTSGRLVEHNPPRGHETSTTLKNLVPRLKKMLLKIETIFGSAQDVEWTFSRNRIFVLQSRPITSAGYSSLSGRASFDIGLRRPLENLRQLREKIEKHLIPDFEAEKRRVKNLDVNGIDDSELILELNRRAAKLAFWEKAYWDVFIPFGHGARIFGEFYSDIMKPEDPYEFLYLLSDTPSQAQQRNNGLVELGRYLAQNPKTMSELKIAKKTQDAKFNAMIEKFMQKFADSPRIGAESYRLAPLVLKYACVSLPQNKTIKNRKSLERKLFTKITRDSKARAIELLELARASYVMRDDDNLMLLTLRKSLNQALAAAQRRINHRPKTAAGLRKSVKAVEARVSQPKPQGAVTSQNPSEPESQTRYIQIRGQPAGKGVATGKAKVVKNEQDLADFTPGAVLVCDSIEPEMNFVVPLAAAIVERRGGMLVHGAIAAREYGIPCVTGIANANNIIADGDMVTVDGYLGIVRINGKFA